MANISCTELCRTLHLALGIVKVRSYTISVHFRIRPDGYNVLYITVRVSHMQIRVIKIGQNRAWKHGFGGLGRLQMLIINQNRILFYQTKIFLFFFSIYLAHNITCKIIIYLFVRCGQRIIGTQFTPDVPFR